MNAIAPQSPMTKPSVVEETLQRLIQIASSNLTNEAGNVAETAILVIRGLQQQVESLRVAKLELDEIEGIIDAQTYEQKRKEQFDPPADFEYDIILKAADERRFNRALSAMTRALLT